MSNRIAPHIEIKGFKKSFDNFVLEIKNLTIRKGEFFCIVGPSGCGKSTLLNCISGALTAEKGSVNIDGEPAHLSKVNRVQMFQQYGLFPWRTVRENIQLGLEFERLPRATVDSKLDAQLDMIGLKEFENNRPSSLSGGMQQRTALARALIVEPSILLMDEPFGALDSLTRLNLQKEIEQIWQRTGTTIIWVTHNVDEALILGDRIGVMTSNPSGLTSLIEVPFSRPRQEISSEMNQMRKQILKELGIHR